MRIVLSREFENVPQGKHAAKILQNCVHCGLCNATCPTYQIFSDELDGPRGRIYQMKQLFEGGQVSNLTRKHLDRCLQCRNCETTCPSGVEYGALLEISQSIFEQKQPRTWFDRLRRKWLSYFVTHPMIFAPLLKLGCWVKPIAPRLLAFVPASQSPLNIPRPCGRQPRKMLALAGCVQSVTTPNTNRAAAYVLDRLGISLLEADAAGCCGSVELHTCGQTAGKATARALIDHWLPYLEEGIEAIVITASGCGMTIKEYPRLFFDEPEYLEKALRISKMVVDLCEVIAREQLIDHSIGRGQKVAFHAPCTLQHGQKIKGVVESILEQAGYQICEVRDSHLCCGAAGTYSILQSSIAARLRSDKQNALLDVKPDIICTANVGCQLHLAVHSKTPIVHWIELLAG